MDTPPLQPHVPPSPPAQIRHATSNVITKDFINYIKRVENGNKKGYDPKAHLWTPHKSYEGGLGTIGYGHKIKSTAELENYKRGISDNDVTKLLLNDLTLANKAVHDHIKKLYKTDVALTQKQSEMLIDYAFNLKGGASAFPIFTRAVLDNDIKGMKAAYTRSAGKTPLKDRNTVFYDRYLK